jgi:hypothetical protein
MRRRRDLAAGRRSSAFSPVFSGHVGDLPRRQKRRGQPEKTGGGNSRNSSVDPFASAGTRVLAVAICRSSLFTLPVRYMGGGQRARAPGDPKDFVKTLRLSAALAALTLTASTTCAAVIDLSNVLGPSGGYTSQAYYQSMLGGQPMTGAQQAYANQEDQLRLLGFLSELGGDIPLGQIFYHIAYGITPPAPPSALDLASGEVTLAPPSITQAASSLALRTWAIRAPA